MNHRIFLAFLFSAAAADSPAQNLILNGSFESGAIVQNSQYANRMELSNGSTVINNWVVGVGGGHFWWMRAPNYNAQDGSLCVGGRGLVRIHRIAAQTLQDGELISLPNPLSRSLMPGL